MSHPNHERRRNRTFRVEVLESRALLSTAGVVSRPAAAVAPLARFAQVSSIPGDPKYEGMMNGKFRVTDEQFEFETSGTVSGKAFAGGKSTFNGAALTGETSNGRIKYTSGIADLTSHSGANMLTVQFTITVHMNKFTLEGTTGLGSGVFARSHQGTIKADGSIDRKTGTIDIKLTVELP